MQKKAHIHTVVDTSGYASREAIERMKDKVDLFLYDLKIMDDKKHGRFTGFIKSACVLTRHFVSIHR